MLSKEAKFFNTKSLYHSVVIFCFSVIADLFIYFSEVGNALSISFYIKVAICIIYVLAVKDEGFGRRENESLECAFHIILVICGFGLAITSYVTFSNPPSKFVGVFLILGLFGLFNIVVELGRVSNQHMGRMGNAVSICLILLKSIFFIVACCSILFLLLGEWRWDIKPFYEW